MEKLLEFLPYIIPVVIIQLILTVIALLDWIKRERTRGNKWVWLAVILFVNLLGPIIYFLFGRMEDGE